MFEIYRISSLKEIPRNNPVRDINFFKEFYYINEEGYDSDSDKREEEKAYKFPELINVIQFNSAFNKLHARRLRVKN